MKIHLKIPQRSIWSLVGLLAVGAFTWIQNRCYINPGFQTISTLNAKTFDKTVVGLIWVPIIAFVLAMIILLLFINIFKKVTDLEDDLPGYIIMGLFIGLIVGIPFGLAGGLVAGIMYSFHDGFVGILCGLTQGFLFGLTAGLMISFILTIAFLVPQTSEDEDLPTEMEQ